MEPTFSFRSRLKDEQTREPRLRGRLYPQTLRRMQARARRGKPIVKPKRAVEPEEVFEELKVALNIYLGLVLDGQGDPELKVGYREIGSIAGYTGGRKAEAIRALLPTEPRSHQYLWREIQHRVRDLLIRQAFRRLAECL